jgi:hypothetical protein
MLSRLKSTAKNSIIYGAGNLSSKLIGLVLLPLYTSVLPVAEFGKLAMLETTAQILVAIFGLSLNSAYFRWYWDKEYSQKQLHIAADGTWPYRGSVESFSLSSRQRSGCEAYTFNGNYDCL